MPLEFSDLAINRAHYDPQQIIAFWRWRVGPGFEVLLPTAMGDLFLEKEDGGIWFLDCYFGQLDHFAASYADFKSKLEEPETFEDWFASGFVGDLLAAGLRRSPTEVYSAMVPPTVGGGMDKANFHACLLLAHHAMYGPILQQLPNPHEPA